MKHVPKVLFLCKKRITTYGISTGLLNSSLFIANYLNEKKIQSKVVSCTDANDIDREVHHYRPTHVIISAIWVPPAKMRELAKKYQGRVQWQIRIHSKIPFIANEGIAFEWLLEYNKIDKEFNNVSISGNSIEFCEALKHSLNIDAIYLPNIYKPDYKPQRVRKIKDNVIDIGCFGAIRPMKNQLIQAMAAIAFANMNNIKIRFHINIDRLEQTGEQVLKNIRALFKDSNQILVEHSWEDHKDFLKTVAQMDIGMQVSLTETFNIVCADFVYMGIPIVVSNEIKWMESRYTVDPLDIHSIIKMLNQIYNNPPSVIFKWIDLRKLGKFNHHSGQQWLKYLDEIPRRRSV